MARKLSYQNINDTTLRVIAHDVDSTGIATKQVIAEQEVSNPTMIQDIMDQVKSKGAITFATDETLKSAGFIFKTQKTESVPR